MKSVMNRTAVLALFAAFGLVVGDARAQYARDASAYWSYGNAAGYGTGNWASTWNGPAALGNANWSSYGASQQYADAAALLSAYAAASAYANSGYGGAGWGGYSGWGGSAGGSYGGYGSYGDYQTYSTPQWNSFLYGSPGDNYWTGNNVGAYGNSQGGAGYIMVDGASVTWGM